MAVLSRDLHVGPPLGLPMAKEINYSLFSFLCYGAALDNDRS